MNLLFDQERNVRNNSFSHGYLKIGFVEILYDYIPVTSLLLGDANSDGKANQADTLHVLKEVVGMIPPPANGTDAFEQTDVHKNGLMTSAMRCISRNIVRDSVINGLRWC